MKRFAVDAAFVIIGVIMFLVVSSALDMNPLTFGVGMVFGIVLVAADEYINRQLP